MVAWQPLLSDFRLGLNDDTDILFPDANLLSLN